MIVVSSVIIVITAISVYEHYSQKNWQEVTSSERNEIVFENRNKNYGAFQIRRQYNNQIVLILLSFSLSIGGIYGSYLYFREPIQKTIIEPILGPDDIITPFDITPEKPKPEVIQPIKKVIPPIEALKNIEPIVVDAKSTEKPPIQSDLNDSNSGIEDSKGANDFIPNKPIIEHVKIVEKINTKIPTEFPKIEAKFPGGDIARMHFIISNISLSDDILESDGGKCFLKFVVDEKGEINSVKVLKGVRNCELCDKEAIRVVKNMPKWIPAEIDGEKVASYFNMTINFDFK